MTPEQCHANHYHSQQVEGSAGWDRYLSGHLHNQQMDGQDEENKRIYNPGDFTKRGDGNLENARKFYWWSIRRGEEEIILGRGPRMSFDLPPTTLLMIQFPNDPTRPLKASSQRPSSQARFSTKFIVLGLLGFGSLTSTVKGTPQNRDPTIYMCQHNIVVLSQNILTIFSQLLRC